MLGVYIYMLVATQSPRTPWCGLFSLVAVKVPADIHTSQDAAAADLKTLVILLCESVFLSSRIDEARLCQESKHRNQQEHWA